MAHVVTKDASHLVNRTTVVAHGVKKEATHLVNWKTVVVRGVTKEAAHIVNRTTVGGTRSHNGGCSSRELDNCC